MKTISTPDRNDAYIGFRSPRKLADALVALADSKGMTVSQLLRETMAQQSERV